MRFILQVLEDYDLSGDALAAALRAAASAFDDPTQDFDDPTDESGFDRSGQVFGREVSTLYWRARDLQPEILARLGVEKAAVISDSAVAPATAFAEDSVFAGMSTR